MVKLYYYYYGHICQIVDFQGNTRESYQEKQRLYQWLSIFTSLLNFLLNSDYGYEDKGKCH